MKIKFTLSKKADAEGRCEILLSTSTWIDGKSHHLSSKSEVYTLPVFFDGKGIDLNKKRVIAPDVRKFHTEQQKKLNGIITAISEAETALGKNKSAMLGDWLANVVDKYLHPEAYMTKEEKDKNKTFYELSEEYLKAKQFSVFHAKGFKVLVRSVFRYEGFVRATDKKRKDFVFNVHTVDRETMEDFRDYLRNEKELSKEYPKLYKELLANYPANIKHGYLSAQAKGDNAVLKLMKKLKAFFGWLAETGRTTNRPFEGITLGSEKVGTPYYISVDERNLIASTPMPTKHLETQRDIFVFQCLVGCRVGDLMRLTPDNVQDDMLIYAPHKTKDEGDTSKNARVPLSETAKALIAKYKGTDKQWRLFPFISDQKYNVAIKEVFTIADITRKVIVRNALTGENELRPINEVASSHMARRTFIGNAYREVQDPNLIGKMSGHVEGSRAFARYRNIDDDTLKGVISKIDTATPQQAPASDVASITAQLATLTPEKLAAVMAIING